MWNLWLYCPFAAELGGIYANKKGYHNTVLANLRKWPGTYSVRTLLDLVDVNRDKARAIDLSMNKEDMISWTSRMKESAEDPFDVRLAAVREFYGTLDGKTVFGMIKDGPLGPWRKAKADKSHLWHGHMGIFTAYVDDWFILSPIVSVWAGQSVEEWEEDVLFPTEGDEGKYVIYWQLMHNACREIVTPPSPLLKVDGAYGPLMRKAISDFAKKRGGTFDGKELAPWIALQYEAAHITRIYRLQKY